MITNRESGTNIHEIADGIYRINTPHMPHFWECGLMMDTTTRTRRRRPPSLKSSRPRSRRRSLSCTAVHGAAMARGCCGSLPSS